ncbi:MAG: hypothetical protein IJY61_02550 [Candidatus Gastranaerophilales bacterium]|nr:hypothetical protein [Candidatus Gastranaerophilales bacterium]
MRITNIKSTVNINSNKIRMSSFKGSDAAENPIFQYKLQPMYLYSFPFFTPNILMARQQNGMAEFFDFLSQINIEEKDLTKQIKDFKFAFNPNFDKKAWTNFISEMNESVAVFDSTGEEKTFLSKLLQIHPLDELLNTPNFKPSKAISFLDELYERTDEEISEIPFTAQLDFMVDFASSDKDVKEYIDDLFYFVELEDINGDRFLSEYVGQMDRNKVDVIKHMLNIDKASVEASNVQMLLELIQNGVVDKHVFDCIPFEGKINSFIVEDIDKLYDSYLEGIDPIDKFVPPVENHSEAQVLLNIGDVYELEGEEKIYILDKDLEPLQLGIDRETYFELFPPIERYATTQNDIGNCWEITAFNTLLTDPKERCSVLSLFDQNGDAISISFPSNNAGKIIFDDGELPLGANPNYYSKGPKGIQLLEYAHGIEEHESQIKILKQQIEYTITNAKTDDRKQELQEKLAMLEEMLAEDRNNVVISLNPETYEWSFEMWDKQKHGFDNAVTYSRDGGDPIILFKKLGYTTTSIKDDALLISSLLANPKNFEDYIITFGTKDDNYFYPQNTPIIRDHSYRLYPTRIDKNMGTVTHFKLVDPSGIIEIQMSATDLKQHDGIYSVARRDKSDKSKISLKVNY